MKRILLLCVLSPCILFVSCDNSTEYQNNLLRNINCDNLRNGLINMNSEIVKSEVDKLLIDLNSNVTPDDMCGQEENINLLIERLNTLCDSISAELICYACIKTNPPQSEILITTDSVGAEIKRVIDVFTPKDARLNCRGIHEWM